MLSSRPYYSNDVEFYRRSEGGLRMSLGQNSPIVEQYDTASQLSRHTTPSSEADKPGIAPRKRVPVACERCRKRKIKCSGDQGGGCSNCHQAGVGNCQFLRVQSIGASDLMNRAALYNRSAYPMRYHPYPYSSACRYPYASSPSAYSPPGHSTYPSMQSGMDYSSYSAPSQNLSWSRSNSYSNAYSPYETETTSPYSSQPPSFILPNTDPMANGNPYLINPYSTKSQSSQVWSEQATSVTQSQPASQIMAAGYSLPSTDSLMTFHSAQSLANANLKSDQALPYQTLSSQQASSMNSDRTLPTPGARNYPSSISTLESLPMSALSHRSSLGWQTDNSSSSSHISSQTSCSSVGGSQDFGTDRPPTHRDSQDLSFGYLGYAASPQSTLPSNALSAVTNESQSSQPPLLTVAAELGSQRCRTVSNESSHESPGAASSSYGYTGATVTRSSQTRTVSGQLSNGATYARARPSFSRRESGAEDCGADCSGCQSSSNRASIASINNLSSY